MKILVTIPLFINSNKEECFMFLRKTIDSIRKYSIFEEILIFYCQEHFKKDILEEIKIYSNTRLIFIKESYPKYLPIDTFNFISEGQRIKDDQYIFYTENDHVLYLNEDILGDILERLDKGYIIMPHRLGKTKMDKKAHYTTHKGLFIGNYAPNSIGNFDEKYDEMLNYAHKGKHNDYAGCYFTKKSTIGNIHIPKYYSFTGRKLMRILGKRSFIVSRFLPKRMNPKKIKRITIPYGLVLEAPSLTLSYRGLHVIKTKNINDLYVEHLSNNGYV